MPLSEHEQRQLDQIERELYRQDPEFMGKAPRGSRIYFWLRPRLWSFTRKLVVSCVVASVILIILAICLTP